jgi:hypothetical protein
MAKWRGEFRRNDKSPLAPRLLELSIQNSMRPRSVLAWTVFTLVPYVSTAQRSGSTVQLRYLGTAGWEITDGTTVVLIDPYLSRLRRVTPNDTVLPSDTRPLFANDSIAVRTRPKWRHTFAVRTSSL